MVWLTLRRSPRQVSAPFGPRAGNAAPYTSLAAAEPEAVASGVLRRVSARAPGYPASINPRNKSEDKPTLPGAAPFPRNRTDRSRSLGGGGRGHDRRGQRCGDKIFATGRAPRGTRARAARFERAGRLSNVRSIAMREGKERPNFHYSEEAEEADVCEITDARLSPVERFRRRRLAIARRCAKRPPKTLSGQSREAMRASPKSPRRRCRTFPL
jgi:hypothetical protein